MSNRRLPINIPQLPSENRTRILGNKINKNVEQVENSRPSTESGNRIEANLISTKQKENNIGLVNTPEQRVGNNQKSTNLDFENNTPQTGFKPFDQRRMTPVEERGDGTNEALDRRVGFSFNQGNFFVNPKDSLPESEVFKMSDKQEVATGSAKAKDTVGARPRNFQEFFNR